MIKKQKQYLHFYFPPLLIWFSAGLFYMYEFVHRVAPSVMVPELMSDFNVSSATLGNLSAYYYYTYAIAQIPVGLILDRQSTKILLTFAATLIALGSYIFSITNSIYIANLCRIIIGFGSAFSFVGCLKLAVCWFSKQKFGIIVGATNFLGVIGAILAGKPLAIYLEKYDWRASMQISAFIGFVFVIVLFIIIQDPPDIENEQKSKSSILNYANLRANITKTKNMLLQIITNKQIWLVAIFGSLMVAPIAAYAELWGVSYLIEKYGITKAEAGKIATLTFIGIAFGGPINGYISDLIKRRKPIMLFGSIGALLTLFSIIYAKNISIINISILHIIFGFFCSSMLLCFSLNSEKVAKNLRSTVIGFTNTLIMGISVLFQPLIGFILDTSIINKANGIFYEENSFQIAFLPLIICLILASLILTKIQESN